MTEDCRPKSPKDQENEPELMTNGSLSASQELVAPQSALSTDMPDFPFESQVAILVGPSEYRFDVHKEILCKASPFFTAAFDPSRWAESSGTLKLPEQEVPIFKFFIRWVYTRRIRRFNYSGDQQPSLTQLERNAKKEAENLDSEQFPWDNPVQKALDCAYYRDTPLLALVKLYILTDALRVRGLQDHVISTISEVYYPSLDVSKSAFWESGDKREAGLENQTEAVNLAWAMTSASTGVDPLIDLLTNIICDHVPDLSVSDEPFDDTLDVEPAKDVYRRLYRWYNKVRDDGEDRPDKWDDCKFHTHSAGCARDVNFPLLVD